MEHEIEVEIRENHKWTRTEEEPFELLFIILIAFPKSLNLLWSPPALDGSPHFDTLYLLH